LKTNTKDKDLPKQAKKAQKGVEVQLCSFFNLGARRGWVVNTTPRQLYPRERDPVPIVQEAVK
jgi:hypothetical protein